MAALARHLVDLPDIVVPLMQVRTSRTIFGYPGFAMVLLLAAVAGGVWLAWTILSDDVRKIVRRRLSASGVRRRPPS
jgi:hypothetical protein